MTVTPVQASLLSSKTTASADATKAAGDYKMFLQLLLTELKNQDPTKPVDPTQTVTQLATFSSLEQAVKTNDLLTSLNMAESLTQGSALIGRTIVSADGATSGAVTSVKLTDSGLVANLSDGRQLPLGSGVSIA
ncbi:MAG: flagellar hook assembly protein FlgD [Methylocystis sp.]|uniref:flagellar hook assembly protein FlgD n=1 Tax=Methylocystis sp. TaxID=1911079 RepID=UPI003DA489F0